MGGKQRLYGGEQFGLPRAGLRQERRTLLGRSGQRLLQQSFCVHAMLSKELLHPFHFDQLERQFAMRLVHVVDDVHAGADADKQGP